MKGSKTWLGPGSWLLPGSGFASLAPQIHLLETCVERWHSSTESTLSNVDVMATKGAHPSRKHVILLFSANEVVSRSFARPIAPFQAPLGAMPLQALSGSACLVAKRQTRQMQPELSGVRDCASERPK